MQTLFDTLNIVAQARDATLNVLLCIQTSHRARDYLATVLGIVPQTIQLRPPDDGGAVGMKARSIQRTHFTRCRLPK